MASKPKLAAVDGQKDQDDSRRIKKINRDMLAKIKLAKKEAVTHSNEATKHQLKANAADNAMRLLITDAMIDLGIPAIGNLVCITCGTVRADTNPPQVCPGCGEA